MFVYPLGDGAGLGQLEPWHGEQFAAAVDHARDHLAPWIPFAHSVTDVASARELLQRLADDHANDTRHVYGIWLHGELVGGAIFPMFDTKNGICELGVWLTPEVQGRGLINRAARYLIDWAIRTRGMSRVEWLTNPNNVRSNAAAKRLGLTFEGVRRSSAVLAGVRHDLEVWSILADEWLPQPVDAGDSHRPVALLDASYGNFHAQVQADVRRGAFGEDIGQNSWLTADEWRRYLGWLNLSENSELLDVASGGGGPAVLAALETGCRVVGVDNHALGIEAAIKLAADRGVADRTRFVAIDGTKGLPFEDATLDAITCIDAVNHFPDRLAALTEWRRVLRPGGHLLFTDPITVTGMLTNEEIRIRSSIGFFQFTPVGTNERLLTEAGFTLVTRTDTTENMEVTAHNWRQARADNHDELITLEGVHAFEGQQTFFQTTSALARDRRLSRITFHATANDPV